jgi:CubicO group peptidase (beta-lactamase class C family)
MKYFLFATLLYILMISCNKDSMNIPTDPVKSLYFPSIGNSSWETTSLSDLKWNENNLQPLLDFVKEKNTKAFIILKDGKIVVEWYGNDFTKNDLWYWASAGKVLTATTVGIAQQEGLLNINDKTSNYLGEGWTNTSLEQENKITVLNQLTMTSGLNSLLFDCTDPACLQFVADASTRWAYHNGPYTLLQSVVENAANSTFESYFNEKLQNKIGMSGSWFSTNGFNNVFFSTARNMARFGLLILNQGTWNDKVIINENYVNDMTNTSQSLNKSYGYLWWLNGKENHMLPQSQNVFDGFLIPNAPTDLFAGLGKNDQKIYVIPSQNLVIVRMGDIANEASLAPTSFDNELWEKINGLIQ